MNTYRIEDHLADIQDEVNGSYEGATPERRELLRQLAQSLQESINLVLKLR